ncbi:MAG: hypothetical protein GX263_03450 [Firmicutes bacterium]|nr:hypothetical protein [Bacillota bacterium]
MKHILAELKDHIPYSVFSAAFALIVVAIFSAACFLIDQSKFSAAAGDLFHVFHPVHMLLSATATTAMFWKHWHNPARAVVVGFLGSVMVCGISDIIIPLLGGMLLGESMHLHICILEHPVMVLPFVFVGIVTGLAAAEVIPRATVFSHTSHVFISSMASVLYLLSYGLANWMGVIGSVFIIIILAVVLPCCISDIVLPLLALPCCGEKSGIAGERAPEENFLKKILR